MRRPGEPRAGQGRLAGAGRHRVLPFGGRKRAWRESHRLPAQGWRTWPLPRGSPCAPGIQGKWVAPLPPGPQPQESRGNELGFSWLSELPTEIPAAGREPDPPGLGPRSRGKGSEKRKHLTPYRRRRGPGEIGSPRSRRCALGHRAAWEGSTQWPCGPPACHSTDLT